MSHEHVISTGEKLITCSESYPLYRVTWEARTYLVEIQLFKASSWTAEAEILDQELAATARIKWDGCSDWEWCETHFCGVQDLSSFCSAQAFCYQLAGELMGASDEESAHVPASEFFLTVSEQLP